MTCEFICQIIFHVYEMFFNNLIIFLIFDIKYYKKYIELLKDDIQTEKIQLKIARLTEDYDLSIIEYNKFLKN